MSYLHNGYDVHLILHIPMAPLDSLLRLFQLCPFPLPFMETHMLMPAPTNQILAILANTNRLSIELSAVHLLCCHHINQVYLCERNGVLKRNLNDTCLSSLYMQDLQGATTLCEMNIIREAKTILQLHDNWYIVHSPHPLTSRIDCLNSSVSEIFIKCGTNCVHVSPSCQLHDAMEDNVRKSTLTTIWHSLAVERRLSIWNFIFGLLSIVIAITIAILLRYAILTRHFLTLRQRVTRWVTLLLPEPVRALMQPPPPPEAAA